MNPIECAVIGAGPAGCTAARLLASWGHDVVVLSRRASQDRALGESLPPSCVTLLERVGFTDFDAAGFLRSTGNTVRWGAGDERVEQFAEGFHGYQVDRAAFDAFLAQQATVAGADMRAGANVTGIRRNDGATIDFECDGKRESLQAEWILDCSGRTGVVARDGWRQPQPAARTTAIVGVWERDGDWPTSHPSHTLVESTENGWAWSVPVSAKRRYVTLMVDPTITAVANKDGLEQAYLHQLERTRSLSALVKGAERAGPVFARDSSPYSARTYGEPGTLVVGDAGSFVDPLSSFGIKKAVASAWLASVVVHSVLHNEQIAAPALDLFNTRERAMYDALRRSAATLARDASLAHPTAFWEARAAEVEAEGAFEPDVAALRKDSDVLRSLEELRSRDAIRLRASPLVRRSSRPTVRGNRVVVEDHLVVPAFPDGIRYVRNVDLVRLTELAPAHRQVPDLFAAYNSVASPAPLPDFLGALSLLIGKGFLEWQVA
jgi:flavin-dependent dehydrogenase